jgi:hypothetical protein
MGIANIDKGKLRRIAASVTAESANARTISIQVSNGYGVPVNGAFVSVPDTSAGPPAVSGAISNAVDYGAHSVEVVIVNADGTTLTIAAPSPGTELGRTVNNSSSPDTARLVYRPNSAGLITFVLTNTATEVASVIVRCGGEEISLAVSYT